MEGAAQIVQPTKPVKPLSVKILQSIYLLLGLLTGVIAIWLVLDSFNNFSNNNEYLKLMINISITFFLIFFAFISGGIGLSMYKRSSITVGFSISILLLLYFVIANYLYYSMDFDLSIRIFNTTKLEEEAGFGLLGVGLTILFFEIILLVLSLISVPVVVGSLRRLKKV